MSMAGPSEGIWWQSGCGVGLVGGWFACLGFVFNRVYCEHLLVSFWVCDRG